MVESKSKEEKPEKGKKEKERRFSQEQYEMLLRCSEKKDMTEWNEWRMENRIKKILLEGADLKETHLEGGQLGKAHLEGADLSGCSLERAYLRAARLEGAKLVSANLNRANLSRANLREAILKDATLHRIYLEEADLRDAHLEGAELILSRSEGSNFKDANLRKAVLKSAHLERTIFLNANLEGADLYFANLEGANLMYAKLQKTQLSTAVVNGSTLIWECTVDRDTDFRGVGLNSARIDEGTKQLLEYNIRRKNWEDWYNEHARLKWLVRSFWWMSDYGRSSGRIMVWFFGLAVAFALAHWLWPNCIMVNGLVGDIRGFVHALYFSVVTMTTLGFGDIAANPDRWQGQVLLMVQVILGYVLLGALVTRFAVLFTAGGPAGKFAKKKRNTKQETLNKSE